MSPAVLIFIVFTMNGVSTQAIDMPSYEACAREARGFDDIVKNVRVYCIDRQTAK